MYNSNIQLGFSPSIPHLLTSLIVTFSLMPTEPLAAPLKYTIVHACILSVKNSKPTDTSVTYPSSIVKDTDTIHLFVEYRSL